MPVCLDFRGGDETKGINHGTRTYFAMPSMMAIRLFDMDSVTLPNLTKHFPCHNL